MMGALAVQKMLDSQVKFFLWVHVTRERREGRVLRLRLERFVGHDMFKQQRIEDLGPEAKQWAEEKR